MNKYIFLKCLKTLPFLMGLFLTLSNAVYWNNYGRKNFINNFTETSISTSLVLYAASTQLGFCQLHKHFIVYDSIASAWVDVKKIIDPTIGYGINFIVVLIGIILIIWLLVHLVKKKKPGP